MARSGAKRRRHSLPERTAIARRAERQIHDAWEVAGEGPGHTWRTENPNAGSEIGAIIRQPNHRRRVDHIFVFAGLWDAHPMARCEIKSAALAFDKPTDGVWPSDDFGVLADLEISVDPAI